MHNNPPPPPNQTPTHYPLASLLQRCFKKESKTEGGDDKWGCRVYPKRVGLMSYNQSELSNVCQNVDRCV